jgi:hypothetical protein
VQAIDSATSKFLRASLSRAKCCIYEETLGGNRHSFPLTQTYQRCWKAGYLSGKFGITRNYLLKGKVLGGGGGGGGGVGGDWLQQ